MNEIRVLDEDNKKLQSRISELENEDRTLKKEHKKMQGRIRELENENYLLREKFANIEERYEKILETYEKVSDAKNELAELVGKERLIMEKKDVSIEVLELPQETIIRLKKSGFKTVDELCRLDNRALIRLKLGNCVSDIRKALYKKGFIPQCC